MVSLGVMAAPLWGEFIGGFPLQNQGREALMFSMSRAWTNGWANYIDAGDFRRHCALLCFLRSGSVDLHDYFIRYNHKVSPMSVEEPWIISMDEVDKKKRKEIFE